MRKESKEKLVEKNIKWGEKYTDKTQFLKDQFEDVVGPGSYFRFEGQAPNGDGYYCIIGPAKVHAPRAKFFAGVRKLPATYSAGGKYFDSLDSAAKYAKETWGVPTPSSLKPYTSKQLHGLSQKVNDWKAKREKKEEREEEREKKLESFNIDVIIKEAMGADALRYRVDYIWVPYEAIMLDEADDLKEFIADNPSFEGALQDIKDEKRKRYAYYKRKYGYGDAKEGQDDELVDPAGAAEMRKIFKTYVGFSKHHGLHAIYVGPYLMAPEDNGRLCDALRIMGMYPHAENGEDIPMGTIIQLLKKSSGQIQGMVQDHFYQMLLPNIQEEERRNPKHEDQEAADEVAKRKAKDAAFAKVRGKKIQGDQVLNLAGLYYADAFGKFQAFHRSYPVPAPNRENEELEKNLKIHKLDMFQDLGEDHVTQEQQVESLTNPESPSPLIQKFGLDDYSYIFNYRTIYNLDKKTEGPRFFQKKAVGPMVDNRLLKRDSTLPANYMNDPDCQIYSFANYNQAAENNMIISPNGTRMFLNRNGLRKLLANMMGMEEFKQYNEDLLHYVRSYLQDQNITGGERYRYRLLGGIPQAGQAGFDFTSDFRTFVNFLTGIGGVSEDRQEALNEWEEGQRQADNPDPRQQVTNGGVLNLDNFNFSKDGALNGYSGNRIFNKLVTHIFAFYENIIEEKIKNRKDIISDPDSTEEERELAEEDIDKLLSIDVMRKNFKRMSETHAFIKPSSALRNSALQIKSNVKNEKNLIAEIAEFMASRNIEEISEDSMQVVVDFLNAGGDPKGPGGSASGRGKRKKHKDEFNNYTPLFNKGNVKPLMIKVLDRVVKKKVAECMEANNFAHVGQGTAETVVRFLDANGFPRCFNENTVRTPMEKVLQFFDKKNALDTLAEFMGENNITTREQIDKDSVERGRIFLNENGHANKFLPSQVRAMMTRAIRARQLDVPLQIKELEPFRPYVEEGENGEQIQIDSEIKDIAKKARSYAHEMEKVYRRQKQIDGKRTKKGADEDVGNAVSIVWDEDKQEMSQFGVHNSLLDAFLDVGEITETMAFEFVEKGTRLTDPGTKTPLISMDENGDKNIQRIALVFQRPPADNVTSNQLAYEFYARTPAQRKLYRTIRSDETMRKYFEEIYGDEAMIRINTEDLAYMRGVHDVDQDMLDQVALELEQVLDEGDLLDQEDFEINDVGDGAEEVVPEGPEGPEEVTPDLPEVVIDREVDVVEQPGERREQPPAKQPATPALPGLLDGLQEDFDVDDDDDDGPQASTDALKNIIKLSQELDNEGKSHESLELLRLAKKFSKNLRKGR